MDWKRKIYPFNIEENVCGLDRLARFLVGTLLIFMAIFHFETYIKVIFLLIAAIMYLNVLAKRCKANEILGYDSCQKPGTSKTQRGKGRSQTSKTDRTD
ncbi:MAG: DUF2892 domain-containing protein [Candidatus Hadarchaeia archaeon]